MIIYNNNKIKLISSYALETFQCNFQLLGTNGLGTLRYSLLSLKVIYISYLEPEQHIVHYSVVDN